MSKKLTLVLFLNPPEIEVPQVVETDHKKIVFTSLNEGALDTILDLKDLNKFILGQRSDFCHIDDRISELLDDIILEHPLPEICCSEEKAGRFIRRDLNPVFANLREKVNIRIVIDGVHTVYQQALVKQLTEYFTYDTICSVVEGIIVTTNYANIVWQPEHEIPPHKKVPHVTEKAFSSIFLRKPKKSELGRFRNVCEALNANLLREAAEMQSLGS